MPYITNSRSIFGRLKDDHHRPFSDPKEHKDETPTPSPAPGRLPLLQRPPVSSITTTTRSKDPDQRSTVNTISTKGTDFCRGGNSLNNEIRRAQVHNIYGRNAAHEDVWGTILKDFNFNKW